jgi:hypothetical protein
VVFEALSRSGEVLVGPTRVNPESGTATAWRGSPPAIVVGPKGQIYVAWMTRSRPGASKGQLNLSLSADGGKSFASPMRVNDKSVALGMQALAVTEDGAVYVTWLAENGNRPVNEMSKMNGQKAAHASAAKEQPEHHQAEAVREVRFAVSHDDAKTFAPGVALTSEACPCCKTVLTAGPNGYLYAGWRQVLPGDFRHIAVAGWQGTSFSAPQIVSDDRWAISGCPVSSASMSPGKDGNLNVLWYAAGESGPSGLYLAQSVDGGKNYGRRQLVAEGTVNGTPVLLTDSSGKLNAIWEGERDHHPALLTAVISTEVSGAKSIVVADGGNFPPRRRLETTCSLSMDLMNPAGKLSGWLP